MKSKYKLGTLIEFKIEGDELPTSSVVTGVTTRKDGFYYETQAHNGVAEKDVLNAFVPMVQKKKSSKPRQKKVAEPTAAPVES